MFCSKVNQRTELRLIDRGHQPELFRLVEANREYLRCWHPWVDRVHSEEDAGKMISAWEQQNTSGRGFCAAISFDGLLCGVINHLTVDWTNRWTALSYWLDAAHQGRGIMTACCRALVLHSFKTWKLNRVTIECAVENTRSRAIPERLGFKLEGVVRGVEWLHDRYADHAVYGLLRVDCPDSHNEPPK
jgi:ribosomal-protein-serine acetyltransferase